MATTNQGPARNAADGEPTYDRHSMLGNLMENYEEDADLPLLYFHSIPEAWVSVQDGDRCIEACLRNLFAAAI